MGSQHANPPALIWRSNLGSLKVGSRFSRRLPLAPGWHDKSLSQVDFGRSPFPRAEPRDMNFKDFAGIIRAPGTVYYIVDVYMYLRKLYAWGPGNSSSFFRGRMMDIVRHD